MSDQDILISNGTCYSSAGEELDESFIPCGNALFGHQTCCGKGDNCLADNACFGVHGSGYGSDLTYMAGCTDPNYEDDACPKKEFDQPWIALTYCDDSDGVWAPCSQDGDPATLQPGASCTCTDASKTTAAFTDASILDNIASLPQATGDHISFFDGHTPTGEPTATPDPTTGTDGSSSSTAGTTTGPTSTDGSTGSPTPDPGNGSGGGDEGSSEDSGLNRGAIIGISVGVAVAVILILGVIGAFIYRRRNRPRARNDNDNEKPPPQAPTPPAVAEADGRPTQPFGIREELEASETAAAATGKGYKPYRKNPEEPEADGRPVTQPWDVRTELEGSEVRRKKSDGPVAELPGSERFEE